MFTQIAQQCFMPTGCSERLAECEPCVFIRGCERRSTAQGNLGGLPAKGVPCDAERDLRRTHTPPENRPHQVLRHLRRLPQNNDAHSPVEKPHPARRSPQQPR